MSNLYVSILILGVYIMGCAGWWARHKQLDRKRVARNRVRRINAYTMGARRSNVVNLDTYSRKVPAA